MATKQDVTNRAEEIESAIEKAVEAVIETAGDEQDLMLLAAAALRRHANEVQKKVNKAMRDRVKELSRAKTQPKPKVVKAA